MTDGIKDTNKLYQQDKLHGRIVWRLWYMSIMLVFSTLIVAYDMLRGEVNILLMFALMAVGGIIGLLMLGIYKFDWDPEKELVVAKRYDLEGMIILVAYMISRVYMEFSFEEVYQHDIVKTIAASFSVLIGLAFVRLIGLTIAVSRTFKDRKKG